MCGFAGVVAWDGRYQVTREVLARMSARIAHRGPDGEGLYLNFEREPATPDHPQVAFAHRRLAILDPDPHANQPFTDHQGRWISYNGEIYNFRELRAELEQLRPEYRWRTTCDTEVLLVGYEAWGEQLLDRLNGMYAFAIWDEPSKSLLLARDRMGQKPLYYAILTRDGRPLVTFGEPPAPDLEANDVPWTRFVASEQFGGIAFASELPALRPVPWIQWDVDQNRIRDYLTYGYVRAPYTVYRAIGQVPPSQYGRFTADHGASAIYYNCNQYVRNAGLALAGGKRAPIDLVATTRELMFSAVRRQLVSDVPLGCFLSGGVDSSVTAAAMKQIVGKEQEVLTFSIGFDDPLYDESEYAQRVADHLKTRHHRFTVKPNAAEDLPKLAAVFGEPFGDSSALPTHYLARETRKHVKVALSGDGGDELFGGYDRYRAMAVAQQFRAMPGPLRMMITSRLWQMLPGVHPKSRLTRIKRLLATLGEDAGRRYAGYLAIFDDATVRELMGPGENAASKWLANAFDAYARVFKDDVRAALAVDRITYLPGDLLTKADRSSMLHALEVRSAFMDHNLVSFAAGLKTDHLLKGGTKRLLREAFAADLPDWVFKRRKMGFAVPIGQWLRGELRSMLRDHLFATDSFAATHFNKAVIQRLVDEHERQRVDHSQRLYALLMLELWWRSQVSP